jgi:hypothetical protein
LELGERTESPGPLFNVALEVGSSGLTHLFSNDEKIFVARFRKTLHQCTILGIGPIIEGKAPSFCRINASRRHLEKSRRESD